MNYVKFFTGNHIFNTVFIAWFIAQFLKMVLPLLFHKKLDIAMFFSAGGMPSSHSSAMVSLTTSVGKICGIYSPEFAIAATVSLIVMYDATGVRRAAGEHAKRLNYLMENWDKTTPEALGKELKEFLGHTPLEVLAGAVLGFVVGMVF